MITLTKLMKGDKVTKDNIKQLQFPLLASPKLDGIRASIQEDGFLYSFNGKPIRNKHTQKLFMSAALVGLDGELIVGSPTDPNCMQRTSSGVMSIEGEPDVTFHVFDSWALCKPFNERLASLKQLVPGFGFGRIKVVPHITIKTVEELERYEEVCLGKGYEGVVLRAHNGPYKNGRSTFKEGWMLKMKRFEDSEAIIIDSIELKHNHNERGADGKRSGHAAGKVAGGVLGAWLVRDLLTGVEFEVGTGFTAPQRAEFWQLRNRLKGRLITYRFVPYGVKEKPRHPVFKWFREDM